MFFHMMNIHIFLDTDRASGDWSGWGAAVGRREKEQKVYFADCCYWRNNFLLQPTSCPAPFIFAKKKYTNINMRRYEPRGGPQNDSMMKNQTMRSLFGNRLQLYNIGGFLSLSLSLSIYLARIFYTRQSPTPPNPAIPI